MTYFKPAFIIVAMTTAGAIAIGPVSAWAQTASEVATEAAPEASPETPKAKQSAAEKFATMDLDGNGLVSEAEFLAYATEAHDASPEDASAKFTQIAGDDGVISLGEFEAVHTAHRKKRAGPGS